MLPANTPTSVVLSAHDLGSSVSGYPISFAADGNQYVAVITGPSGVAGAEERVAPDLMQGNAPNVFTFALP